MGIRKTRHKTFTMAVIYLFVALIIQGTFINANGTEEFTDSQEILNKTDTDDEVIANHEPTKDWIDMFLLPDTPLYPTSSAVLMAQATNSEKPVEEQIEDIKVIADKITLAIQSEMANLLSYALAATDKENDDKSQEDNNLRKKRSADTPMDSSQLITRLLKHIKNNNEYQNIAIEKMMTAQEIADKYGIDYRPDTEILSDLAFAANNNAKEMTSMLKDACDMKNVTNKIDPVEYLGVQKPSVDTYNGYTDHYHEPAQSINLHDYHFHNPQPEANHYHYSDSYPSYNYYYNYPYETQIPSPPPVENYYSPAVSKKPNFYDTIYQDFTPSCSFDSLSSPASYYEDLFEPEPELVGEEFEETVTSRVLVDRGDEPGSATVNHVMTYTVSEKSHFKTPEIERLPQQMQYCFFLM